jgi:ribosomal RNA-processing protein 8
MFHEYHEGFRRQVEVWPENPVDTYIEQVRKRGKFHGRGKAEQVDSEVSLEKLPLPRTGGTCYIADLGCGDAKLTQALEKEKKALKVQVFSYDLQNPSPLVTKADISNLPLEDNSVDVAIFCLALMGTNWVDFIEEAFRILRWKGELWVAEIKSRFGRVGGANKRVVEHSVGNRKKTAAKTSKKMDDDADNADLLVEVDGHDDNKAETDVTAFVEVLRKRGFVLQGDNAIDLSNRMFVKMAFVKGTTPIKGKCVPVPKGMEKIGQATWKPKSKAKFLEEEEVPISSEAGVLKPCVYKLR